MNDEWLWITRWEDFQHYAPSHSQGPAWIKNHTKQLSDSAYLALNGFERGALHSIRLCFAHARCVLDASPTRLSQMVGLNITPSLLKRLSDAGFIEIVPRATLEQRLEAFYASRAPARSRRNRDRTEEDSYTDRSKTTAASGASERPARFTTSEDLQTLASDSMAQALRLLAALSDKDDGTKDRVLELVPQLPPAAFADVLDRVTHDGQIKKPSAYACSELRRMVTEHVYS